MTHSFFDVNRPVVIGHRGNAGSHPENTLLSFETALACGAQILESDIHLTRDGIPILLHDPSLDRTTTGTGLASESTWAEIQKLDAGFHFKSEDGETPFRSSGITIPSLEQAFERFPDARFNLEIKCHGIDGIRSTLDLIERFDRADLTLLAAGENDIMRELRTELETRKVAPAMGSSLEEILATAANATLGTPIPEGVMALQVPPSVSGNPIVTRDFVDHAHANGLQVHVWTINDLKEIESLLDLGVDGIITDHPARMHDWLVATGRR